MEISFRPANIDDAALISQGIIEAIGPEVCLEILDPHGATLETIGQLFENLARRNDSQYSWQNTLIAYDKTTNEPMGLVISYDGARLHELRKAFIQEAHALLGWDAVHELPDETDDKELYIDTLYVVPKWRGLGVGRELLDRTARSAYPTYRKRAGLLVAKDNDRARRLYKSLGFRDIGERQFFDETMDHMVRG